MQQRVGFKVFRGLGVWLSGRVTHLPRLNEALGLSLRTEEKKVKRSSLSLQCSVTLLFSMEAIANSVFPE